MPASTARAARLRRICRALCACVALAAAPSIALLAAATPGSAADLCVVCQGPDALYRCQVNAPAGLERSGIADRVVQYVCVSELARHGGHASCSVRRDNAQPCSGELKIVSVATKAPEGTAPQPAGTPPVPAAQAPAQPAPAQSAAPAQAAPLQSPSSPPVAAAPKPEAPPADAKTEPPRTMVELAKRTGEASKIELQKTGRAVGNAMQKTWDCLTTLFTGC